MGSGLSERATTSPGLAMPGTGFNREALIQLKIVVFAPMPSASVRIVISAYPGALRIIRNAYRTSCQKDAIVTSYQLYSTKWQPFRFPKKDILTCLSRANENKFSILIPSPRDQPDTGYGEDHAGKPRNEASRGDDFFGEHQYGDGGNPQHVHHAADEQKRHHCPAAAHTK